MNRIPVTVYTNGPACVQCNSTKRMMKSLGINFTEVDLREHPELVETFREQGHTSAPIVTTDIKIWSGFRHSKIVSLHDYIKSMEKNG